VNGLIIAGSADIKAELVKSDLFDPRLSARVIKVVDISYGGEVGFNQAIELSSDTLKNVKLLHEKKVINRFFEEISKDTGKYVYGVKDTWEYLNSGYVDTLIINEEFRYHRLMLRDSVSNNSIVEIVEESKINENSSKYIHNGDEYEVLQDDLLIEWLMEDNNYKQFVSTLEIVSDSSSEGVQLVRGFGGFAGVLRYKVENDFEETDVNYELDEEDFI
jgi:peptide chain release factor subunit 1